MATTYMGLVLPTPTVTPGPLYAYENNQALTVIDSHNHSPGQGAPVVSASISINADLPFNSYNATLLRSSRYVDQLSPLALPTDIGIIYIVGGDLYYNNSIGQAIQLTAGAALNAASIGGIGGDYGTSTASLFYTSATSTFTFWSAPSTPAIIDSGPIILRNVALSSFGITLSPPVTLSVDYSLTLPTGLPASTKILTVDSSGNIAFVYDVDNVTLEVASNTLRVKDGGITFAKMASNSVNTAQLIDQSVTQAKLAPKPTGITVGAGGYAVSLVNTGQATNDGTIATTITDLTVTITTTGRPVRLALTSDGTSQAAIYFSNAATAASGVEGKISFVRDGTSISLHYFSGTTQPAVILGAVTNGWPASSVSYDDIVPAGTYTYTVKFGGLSPTTSYLYITNIKLVAYEI